MRKLTGEPGRSSVRAAWGRFFSTFEGATNFNEIGDAPFGNYYGSPVPPEFVTPFVDRGTGNIEGQRFPVPPPPQTPRPVIQTLRSTGQTSYPLALLPPSIPRTCCPTQRSMSFLCNGKSVLPSWFRSAMWARKGHHLLSSLEANPGNAALCLSVSELNEVAPGTSTCGPNGENGVYTTAAGNTINGTRGPFGENFTSEGYFITAGNSNYNSFQASVRQRISHLLTWRATLTRSPWTMHPVTASRSIY